MLIHFASNISEILLHRSLNNRNCPSRSSTENELAIRITNIILVIPVYPSNNQHIEAKFTAEISPSIITLLQFRILPKP